MIGVSLASARPIEVAAANLILQIVSVNIVCI